MVEICQATTAEQIAEIRRLFEEYAVWSSLDLCFQGFARELESLPGSYTPPRVRLLLATAGQTSAGCAALRPATDGVCEMKRFFVRPDFRGQGLGKQLARQLIADARGIGYATMVLDTLPSMKPALGLYESLGFVRRSAYYDTPLAETVFMELRL